MSKETEQVNSRGLEWLINEQKKATELAAYLQGLIDDLRGTPRANYSDGSRRKSWTNEDRENLIRLVDLGHTAREISNMIGKPYNTVYNKVNLYKRTGSILRGGPEAYELCPECGINLKLLTSKKCVNCYNKNAKNAPKS